MRHPHISRGGLSASHLTQKLPGRQEHRHLSKAIASIRLTTYWPKMH
jgi:hypothetical protein